MPEYTDCGGHVTKGLKRVYAGRDGDVHGYPECMNITDIKNGEAIRT